MKTIPLYVDLDGTYTKTDTLHESLISILKKNPITLLKCMFSLRKGIAHFKETVASNHIVNVESLPVHHEFQLFLQEQSKRRTIILATASNENVAQKICQNSDIFSSYIASSANKNLKGSNKLNMIKDEAPDFAYAGNSLDDMVIFKEAKESYLVNPEKRIISLKKRHQFDQIFENKSNFIKELVKELRVYQWVKNILLFVPLLTSGSFFSIHSVILTVLGFFSFSILASGTYLINDLFDIENDRNHERKKNRPIAAGNLSIKHAIIISFLCIGIAYAIGYYIGLPFTLGITTYLITTLLYSFVLKKYTSIDIITLAGLYTLRIIVGSLIINVDLSFWLLTFSMLIFFNLAIIKRVSELLATKYKQKLKGRGYTIRDYPVLMTLGVSSALMSVIIFCFYTNNNILVNQYQKPTVLWLIVPALAHWLTRIWLITNRGKMTDDPIIFAIKDKVSLITITIIAITTLIAQVF